MKSLLILLIPAFLVQSGWAQEEEENRQAIEIQRNINLLGDEDFATRKKAHEDLLAMGEPVVPFLTEALRNDSPERRKRARKLIAQIRERWFMTAFTKLAKQAEEDMDIEHAMFLIARIIDDSVEKEAILKKLDEIAGKVRAKFGAEIDLAKQAPERVVQVMIEVLSKDYALQGDHNLDSYDHPFNSSIHHALTEKKALPIILSEITAAVARRLKVPVVGIPIPGRYMFKYDGSHAPVGHPKDDIVIDPHGGWQRVTLLELRRFPLFREALHLAPAPPRQAIVRMLTNLHHDFLAVGQQEDADRVEKWIEVMLPDDPENPGLGP